MTGGRSGAWEGVLGRRGGTITKRGKSKLLGAAVRVTVTAGSLEPDIVGWHGLFLPEFITSTIYLILVT